MTSKPYRLQGINSKRERGCVSPSILQFESKAEGEIVAERYRAAYPTQSFRIIKVDALGYEVME